MPRKPSRRIVINGALGGRPLALPRYTPESASEVLPKLQPFLEQGQAVLREMRTLRDQLVDLKIVWGEKIERPECPDHAEYERYHDRFRELEAEMATIAHRFHELGAELKDLEAGLVDFRGEFAGAEVYLCWKKGEPRVAHWHPLDGGFAARRPLPTT